MIRRLGKIIKKNIKVLLRSKSSALIVILGPLLVIFLVGVAFNNTETYSVRIGTYAASYSDLSNQINDNMVESGFKVTKYDSEADCIDAIKQTKIHTCMVYSDNLQSGIDGSNEVVFHIDYSKINLVWMILDTVSSQIESKATEISKDLSGVLLSKIEFTRSQIKADKATLLLITNEQNNIKTNIDSMQSNLAGLNLNMVKGKGDVEFVANQTLTIAVLGKYMVEHAKKMITGVRGGLDSLNTSASNENKTKAIKQVVDEAEYKINNINGKIANKSANITVQMTELANSMSEAKSKLEAAGATRTTAYEQIKAISSSVDSAVTNLASIQASFDKIEDTLSNLQVTEAEDIASPIKTTVKPVTTEGTHLNYMFPSLIVMVIMFISILLSSTFVIMEKKSKAYFRNFITPTGDFIFVLATYLTTLILMTLQLAVILIVAHFAFDADVISTLYISIPVLLLIVTLFTFIGMFIGYLFKSEETATLAAISTGSVFLFMSSVILPIESMPEYIAQIAVYNPFVMAELLVRKIIIFSAPVETLVTEIGIIASVCLLLFGGLMILQKFIRKHYVSRVAKRLVLKKKKK